MPTAGQRILAQDFTAAVTASDTTTQTNITGTSGSPNAGSPTVTVTVTAPTSGKIAFTIGGRFRDAGASATMVLDWTLREGTGSGSIVLNTGDSNRRIEMTAETDARTQNWTRTYIATGLTPGQVYFAQLYHWATPSGSADVIARYLATVPLPG